jgi:hypothetical protein
MTGSSSVAEIASGIAITWSSFEFAVRIQEQMFALTAPR